MAGKEKTVPLLTQNVTEKRLLKRFRRAPPAIQDSIVGILKHYTEIHFAFEELEKELGANAAKKNTNDLRERTDVPDKR